jgi:hypothetical protein
MPNTWELAQTKWNIWKSNSYKRKQVLKQIGRASHHAARAYGFLPLDVRQDLTNEYARTQFEYSVRQEEAA